MQVRQPSAKDYVQFTKDAWTSIKQELTCFNQN